MMKLMLSMRRRRIDTMTFEMHKLEEDADENRRANT